MHQFLCFCISGTERNKRAYRLFVGQQLFPDPEEVFAELSQPFNEALLQFFLHRGREREREKEKEGGEGGERERKKKKSSEYMLSQLKYHRIKFSA